MPTLPPAMFVNNIHVNNLFINLSLINCFQGFNSSLASCDFCHLLITFANSLDPDQDRQNIGAVLQTLILNFEKKVSRQQRCEKLPSTHS